MNTKTSTRPRQISEDEESEGLALLIPDIQETARIVNVAVFKVLEKRGELVILLFQRLPCVTKCH